MSTDSSDSRTFLDQIFDAGLDFASITNGGTADPEALATWHAVHGVLTPIVDVSSETAPAVLMQLQSDAVGACARAFQSAHAFITHQMGKEAADAFLAQLRSAD